MIAMIIRNLKHSFFLYLNLCFWSLGLLSQNNKNSDYKLALSYLTRAQHFSFNQIDSNLYYSNKCLNIANTYGLDSLRFEALCEIAYAHYLTRRTGEGINVGLEALKISKEQNQILWQAKASNRLGLLYQNAGKYGESIIFFEKSLAIYEAEHLLERSGTIYNNIANSYLEINDFDKTIAYRKMAITIRIQANDSSGLGDSYNDIGETFIKLEEFDSARFYLYKSLLIKGKLGDTEVQSMVYNNLGTSYLKEEKWQKALTFFDKSERMALQIKAVGLLKDICLNKSKCYMRLDDFQASYQYLDLHRIYMDSSYHLENRQLMNELNAQFQNERKTTEINTLKKDKEQADLINQEKDLRKNLIIIFCILFLAAASVFGYYMNKRFKESVKQKQTIETQKLEVDEKNKNITDSINYAKRIQEAMLPEKKVLEQLFPNAFVLFLPKDIVSGDFYWFAEYENYRFAAAVDCTGHGVPGAFMSMIGNAFLNEIVVTNGIKEPASILNELRSKIIHALKQSGTDSNSKDGMDIALIRIDERAMDLQFAGANNPLWLIKNNSGNKELIEIKGDKQPIGVHINDKKSFTNHSISLVKGDTVYLFTDGFADQFGGESGKKFKYKNLKDLLLQNIEQVIPNQKQILHTAFNGWKGNLEQVDDVLLIGIKLS
jgi:serine phosphatase RsbU (regulator of sigma subunit)